jgi:hypothetical protein
MSTAGTCVVRHWTERRPLPAPSLNLNLLIHNTFLIILVAGTILARVW